MLMRTKCVVRSKTADFSVPTPLGATLPKKFESRDLLEVLSNLGFSCSYLKFSCFKHLWRDKVSLHPEAYLRWPTKSVLLGQNSIVIQENSFKNFQKSNSILAKTLYFFDVVFIKKNRSVSIPHLGHTL